MGWLLNALLEERAGGAPDQCRSLVRSLWTSLLLSSDVPGKPHKQSVREGGALSIIRGVETPQCRLWMWPVRLEWRKTLMESSSTLDFVGSLLSGMGNLPGFLTTLRSPTEHSVASLASGVPMELVDNGGWGWRGRQAGLWSPAVKPWGL